MSRDHAEIWLVKGSNVSVSSGLLIWIQTDSLQLLMLQDVGSTHGTRLNGIKLARKEPKVLTDGDIVTFGAEVRRGSDTFPACSFTITYECFPLS
jgi:pSer/pThr/pTyr-binding forkhead associated (FHA) protein